MAGTVDTKRLVEEHLSLVQAIARKLKKTMCAAMDVEDLIGYGSRGLLEAAERFDPQHGVTFTTFAYYRIRGAMLDGMRTMGWYSRADYARYRAEERANEYLQNLADREGAAEAAGQQNDLEATIASLQQTLSAVATIHITSIDAAATVADESLPAPDAGIEASMLRKRMHEAIEHLPEKERRLMQLYYFEERNLEQAGAELGLSKSWACRLHARAVDMLRAALEGEV